MIFRCIITTRTKTLPIFLSRRTGYANVVRARVETSPLPAFRGLIRLYVI